MGSSTTERSWEVTTIVRCGHFRLDGALVKPTQQVLVDGPLVVPLAALDSELQPVKRYQDADDCFDIYYGMELLNLHCIV
jgi:hypothetical protein